MTLVEGNVLQLITATPSCSSFRSENIGQSLKNWLRFTFVDMGQEMRESVYTQRGSM